MSVCESVSMACTVSVATTVTDCSPAVARQVTLAEAPVCFAPSTLTAYLPEPPFTLQLSVTVPPVRHVVALGVTVRVNGSGFGAAGVVNSTPTHPVQPPLAMLRRRTSTVYVVSPVSERLLSLAYAWCDPLFVATSSSPSSTRASCSTTLCCSPRYGSNPVQLTSNPLVDTWLTRTPQGPRHATAVPGSEASPLLLTARTSIS